MSRLSMNAAQGQTAEHGPPNCLDIRIAWRTGAHKESIIESSIQRIEQHVWIGGSRQFTREYPCFYDHLSRSTARDG